MQALRCNKGKCENGSKVYIVIPIGRNDMHVRIWWLQAQGSVLRFKSQYFGLHCTLASLHVFVMPCHRTKDGPVRPGLTSLLPCDETRRARTGL